MVEFYTQYMGTQSTHGDAFTAKMNELGAQGYELAAVDNGTMYLQRGAAGGGEGTVGPPGPAGPAGATGPAGPSAVSTDSDNLAVLGSDNLVLVPNRYAFKGVTDGSDAADGNVGQYLSVDNMVGVTPDVNTPTQICTIALPPGCFEIWGACDFTIATTEVDDQGQIAPNQLASSISLHADALPTQDDLILGIGVMNLIYSPLASGQRQVLITGQCRSNSPNPIDLFLVAAVGSASATVKGYLSARRVR
jgi:hypothetical protein